MHSSSGYLLTSSCAETLNVLTDGGDGNWSVATACFYGLLVGIDIFKVTSPFVILFDIFNVTLYALHHKTVNVYRLPPGHTHRRADSWISLISRCRYGLTHQRYAKGAAAVSEPFSMIW